ncbi:hypothetical protein Bca52824_041214 [Brassica carinata]|uniref:Cation/H(+) antiporter C-terminal domain-containing protein n=1 Tax=Brassica carinata TaxID=52824 RepID=A0A8X7RUG1_BRACI|nr:hypothetical protein Bca52824_041214 [Brassica carinata]
MEKLKIFKSQPKYEDTQLNYGREGRLLIDTCLKLIGEENGTRCFVSILHSHLSVSLFLLSSRASRGNISSSVAVLLPVALVLLATSKCNLFVVGRNAAVVPLVNSTDCPELGPVGRLLSSSEFSTTASVLVVQGYDSAADTRPVVEDDDYEQSSREIGDSTV